MFKLSGPNPGKNISINFFAQWLFTLAGSNYKKWLRCVYEVFTGKPRFVKKNSHSAALYSP
jgi:hypothetical protein